MRVKVLLFSDGQQEDVDFCLMPWEYQFNIM